MICSYIILIQLMIRKLGWMKMDYSKKMLMLLYLLLLSTTDISIYILSNIYRYSFRDNGNDLSCSEAIWNAGLLFLYIFNNFPQKLKLSENLHFSNLINLRKLCIIMFFLEKKIRFLNRIIWIELIGGIELFESN